MGALILHAHAHMFGQVLAAVVWFDHCSVVSYSNKSGLTFALKMTLTADTSLSPKDTCRLASSLCYPLIS